MTHPFQPIYRYKQLPTKTKWNYHHIYGKICRRNSIFVIQIYIYHYLFIAFSGRKKTCCVSVSVNTIVNNKRNSDCRRHHHRTILCCCRKSMALINAKLSFLTFGPVSFVDFYVFLLVFMPLWMQCILLSSGVPNLLNYRPEPNRREKNWTIGQWTNGTFTIRRYFLYILCVRVHVEAFVFV